MLMVEGDVTFRVSGFQGDFFYNYVFGAEFLLARTLDLLACGVCCEDTPTFTDAHGASCSEWSGYSW